MVRAPVRSIIPSLKLGDCLSVQAYKPCSISQMLSYHHTSSVCLVGCFGFNGPLRQYFSLYRAVSQREGERGERIDESKNVQTTPTRTYCKHNRPLPYHNQNCRTPQHWKLTQHRRTTRPPHTRGQIRLILDLLKHILDSNI